MSMDLDGERSELLDECWPVRNMLSSHSHSYSGVVLFGGWLLLKGLPRRPSMLHQPAKGLQQQNLCVLQDRVERRLGMEGLKGGGRRSFKPSEVRLQSRDPGVEGNYRCVGFVLVRAPKKCNSPKRPITSAMRGASHRSAHFNRHTCCRLWSRVAVGVGGVLKVAVVMAGGTDRGIGITAPGGICGWLRLTCSPVADRLANWKS